MRPPRRRRRAEQHEPNRHDPLPRLRRRCIAGACIAAGIFIAAFAFDLGRHSTGDNMPIIGVEMAACAVFILSVFTIAAMRIAAQNTIYALSIWKIATRAAQQPATTGQQNPVQAVPIGHGREIQRRRGGQRAG